VHKPTAPPPTKKTKREREKTPKPHPQHHVRRRRPPARPLAGGARAAVLAGARVPPGRVQAPLFRARAAASAEAGRAQHQDLLDLPVGPGLAVDEAAPEGLPGGPVRLRADGAGRAAQDQERAGPDARLPPQLPRGHLRELRHEHGRRQRPRLPHQDLRRVLRVHRLAAAPHVRRQGPRRRHDQLLQPVQERRALAQAQGPAAEPREGGAADQARPRQARRHVRVHPLRLLLHVMPVLLVEPGGVPRPRRAAPSQQVYIPRPLFGDLFDCVD
jgi:hypothetical protein